MWSNNTPHAAEDGIDIEDLPDERRHPTLDAEVFALAEQSCWSKMADAIPEEIAIQTFDDPADFVEGLSSSVAVAVFTTAASGSRLESLVKQTIRASEHARFALLTDDHSKLLQCDVPHDESLVTPISAEDFEALIKRLYVRAYYSVALERFYEISIAIRNREIHTQPGDDDRLQRLRRSRRLMRSYLRQFRAELDAEDLKAMENRSDRLESLSAASKSGPDPSVVGLPDSCPDCGLDWSVWHGPRLRNGYQKIGAHSWRCTQCGSVLSNAGPDNYRVS